MIEEKVKKPLSGWLMLAVTIALIVGGILMMASVTLSALWLIAVILGSIFCFGFQAVAPNDARALKEWAYLQAEEKNFAGALVIMRPPSGRSANMPRTKSIGRRST